MVRRSNYRLVETIISALKEEEKHISYDSLSQKTQIKPNNLKNWLKIIKLIQSSSLSIKMSKKGIITQVSSFSSLNNTQNIHHQVKKRDEDPNLQEFFTEFKDVLSKTKTSLEDAKIKNYPNLNTQPSHPRTLTPEYSDLQKELTQVLEQGISFLSSSKNDNCGQKSKNEQTFFNELKQAVNLGIENLEKVVVTDYRKKRGRVNAMKSELELVFESRKKRLEKSTKPIEYKSNSN